MVSLDREIYIVIDGQEYQLSAESVSNGFRSEILKRLDGLESSHKEIKAEQKTQASMLNVLHEQSAVQTSRLDLMLWIIGAGFALMTILIGGFTLWLSTPKAQAPAEKLPEPIMPPAPQPIIIQLPYPSMNGEVKTPGE